MANINQVETLVSTLNAIIQTAHEREVNWHQDNEKPYDWEVGLSREAVREQLLSVNNEAVIATERSKYIAIDRCGGKFLVEKSTGDIYGIKGYGVIHRGYRYGNVANPDLKTLACKLFGQWNARFVEAL